ncbi:MAG: sigma-70 family RNA polymerase sigma factor [Verrucomicrobia bacterium]|nr:sigma-70 family RNA polymerase sigma factor [Verrucomicrobiota bacterium]
MKIEASPHLETDLELWERSRGGDREAFGRIVERYQSLLCSVAFSSCGSLARSEDLAQEAFLAAWRQVDELREPSKIRSWLCGIVRHLAASAARRDHRRGGSPLPLEAAEDSASLDADPSASAISREEEQLLWRSLEELPEPYREPLVLFYRQGQSVAAVADALEISEDAVKQRLSRGRAMLRQELSVWVETSLERTKPSAAFRAAVLAGLPALASSGVEAAAASSAVAGHGTAGVKGLFTATSSWPVLGPVAGLMVGWLSASAAASTGHSEAERAWLRKHGRRVVLFCWLMSLGLALVLMGAGKWYTPSAWAIVLGVFAWTAVLVGTILGYGSFIDREVLRIRKATGTVDAEGLDSEGAQRWPRVAYLSTSRFLNLPLVAIGPMGDHGGTAGRQRVVGWIAVGDFAISPLIALGGVAIAPVAVGGITIGVLSLSLWGIGAGVLAFGSLAVGWWAFGFGALGWEAALGVAAVARDFAWGVVAQAAEANTPAVKVWFFSQWFFWTVLGFLKHAHWVILMVIVVSLGWCSAGRVRAKAVHR